MKRFSDSDFSDLYYPVLKMNVNYGSFDETVSYLLDRMRKRIPTYVCVSNVHMCIEVDNDFEFEKVVNGSTLTVPDGRPIYWALKLFGLSPSHIRGQDLTSAMCEASRINGFKVGLIGCANEAKLDLLISNLEEMFKGIDISFSYCPPFRNLSDEEMLKLAQDVNNAGVDLLLVGIGCPKQERLMNKLYGTVTSTMLGVGAVFDFINKDKKHAPVLLQKLGLEWAFRLLSEPKRLWRRYLYTNPRFIIRLAKQYFLSLSNK